MDSTVGKRDEQYDAKVAELRAVDLQWKQARAAWLSMAAARRELVEAFSDRYGVVDAAEVLGVSKQAVSSITRKK